MADPTVPELGDVLVGVAGDDDVRASAASGGGVVVAAVEDDGELASGPLPRSRVRQTIAAATANAPAAIQALRLPAFIVEPSSSQASCAARRVPTRDGPGPTPLRALRRTCKARARLGADPGATPDAILRTVALEGAGAEHQDPTG